MTRLGAEWIAAIALSIQAVIFLLQAGFLCWQATILRRHATTLEKHTEIADVQAETAKLIGQALDQQGKVLTDQTTIMGGQFSFQQKLATQAERTNVRNLIVAVHGRLVILDSKLSRATFAHTAEFRQDVDRHFDALAGAVYGCQKQVSVSIHLTEPQKKYFLAYCDSLASLHATGNNNQDFDQVRSLKDKYEDDSFSRMIESLGDM